MDDSVKKFSFFKLPLRVFNLEKLVESLIGNPARIQVLETQLADLTERVDSLTQGNGNT